MAGTGFRSGLFGRLVAPCGSAALAGAVIAIIAFHGYRGTLTTDRLATELTTQAHAIAPLAVNRLDAGDDAGATRLLRAFAGLPYVTCVDMVREDAVVASFPPLGCDPLQVAGNVRDVDVSTGDGVRLLFRVRVDDDLLMAPVRAETAVVAGLMMLLVTVILLVLSLSFQRKVLAPLDALRTAMQAFTPNNPVRADLLHDDEIGAIVKAYNSLVAAARLFFRRLERSQIQLADSERRFRDLAEVSGDWFFEMDSELRLSFISDRFFEITGRPPSSAMAARTTFFPIVERSGTPVKCHSAGDRQSTRMAASSSVSSAQVSGGVSSRNIAFPLSGVLAG